jgi:5-(carboxyamino)imidazole ribonucleotide synthase
MKIGILGAGQLGRMLALSGIPLNHTFKFLDPAPNSPASVAGEQLCGNYDDTELLDSFIKDLDVVTYEFENVSAKATNYLTNKVKVFPPPKALEITQDRIFEKRFFNGIGVHTAGFYEINSKDDLISAVKKNGYPCILKTRRMGYDGKGQYLLKSKDDLDDVLGSIEASNLILEDFVKFDREVSIICVKAVNGQTKFYSLVENRHREGILRLSTAPAANTNKGLQETAENIATKVLDALDYVGVLAIEFFVADGKLLANEMACRVHNSGHWTIEGAETSQFENHIRAVAGQALGSVNNIGYSAMFNIIGEPPDTESVLSIPGAHLHLYGKEPRPNRKLGHITYRSDNFADFNKNLINLTAQFL